MSKEADQATSAAEALVSLRSLCRLFLEAQGPTVEEIYRLGQAATEAADLWRAEVAVSAARRAERLVAALDRAGLPNRFGANASDTISSEALALIEELADQAANAQVLIRAAQVAVEAALQQRDFASIGTHAEAGKLSSDSLDAAIRGIEDLLSTSPAASEAPAQIDSASVEMLADHAGDVSSDPGASTAAALSEPTPHTPAIYETLHEPIGEHLPPVATPEPAAATTEEPAAPVTKGPAPAEPPTVTASPNVPEPPEYLAPEPAAASTEEPVAPITTGPAPAEPPTVTASPHVPELPEHPAPEPRLGRAVPMEGAEGSIARSLFNALTSERLGLAEALCEVASEEEIPPLLCAAVPLAAMALVADGSGVLDDRVRDATQRAVDALLVAEDTADAALGLALLLPAATNLALLSPGADQTDLLNRLVGDRQEDELTSAKFPMLRDLAQTMQRGRVAGAALRTSEILAGLLTEEAWQAELEAASAAAAAWRDVQSARTIKFSGATDVWHEMVRTAFEPPIRLARSGDANRSSEVQRFLTSLNPMKLIRDTELQVRGTMAARRNPIHSDALRRLEECLAEGVQLLQSWVNVAARAPSRGQKVRSRPVAELRDQVLTRIVKAEAEVATLSGVAHAAIPIANRLLARLRNVLQGDAPAGAEPHLDAFLGRDLAPLEQLHLLPGWQRQRPVASELRNELQRLAASPPPEPGEAAQRRIDSGNFVGAALVVELVADDEARSKLQRALRNAVERRKVEVIGEIEAQRSAVEHAERAGRIEAGEAEERIESLLRARELIATALPDTAEELFGDARGSITETQRKLEDGRTNARARIEHRFAQLRLSDEGTREKIEMLLKAEQFALAEDLVDQLEAGEPIEARPPPAVEDVFATFFPERAGRIAEWLGRRTATMQDIAGKALALPADLWPSDEQPPDDLPRLAAAWVDCVRESGRNQLQDALLRLLMGLGFTDPQFVGFATPPRRATELRVELRVRPLRDRATAVLPDFGSYANGAYTLLCLWQKRDVEDVTQALAALRDGNHPTIVLFFGPLDNAQRRRLAGLARADRLRTTIVVDEVLALHLGTLQRQRLMSLFACTLPFTDCRPWTDTGTPAPEMFFGRARELSAIEGRSGDFTHLIYGGRQLGKTALLRHVERAAAERPDTVARYLSIAELGQQLPHTALWQRLADELARAGIPLQRTPSDRNVRTGIREWLDARPGRRLLLLLDEADAFFEKDREGKFGVTTALRDLTVETDRRFKPVFAGLHNVQKLARDANSPIAHLGVPLVVGPMLRGEERREAEHLVRWPFAALGYRLDDAVVSRILTFANYYPSLIQVVCQRLLRELRHRVGGGGGGPPWQVQIEHIERVLETPDLRSAAFERFRITLELDERYTLMTLVVASFSMGEPQLLASGIDRGTLRDLAAAAWPEGFPSSFSDDAFEALLDEMVGLGLLRSVGGSHFALRSANLAHLIGRPGDISRQIEEFAKRPAPPRHDPLEMRRQVDGRPGLLTTRQEGHLVAPGGVVAILAGARLAGIDSWKAAIEAACRSTRDEGRERVTPRFFPEPYSLDALGKALADRPRNGSWLHVIPPGAPWDANWVRAAYQRFRTPSRSSPPTRVVFIADAQRVAAWVADPGRTNVLDAGESAARVTEMTAGPLGPADINQWDGPDRLGQTTAAIFAATGGWDALLRRLEAMPHGERAAAKAEALAGRLVQADECAIGDILVLPEVGRVLGALGDCVSARLPNEVVDAATVAAYLGAPEAEISRVLELGELLAVVVRGPYGFALNAHVALALAGQPASA